MSFNANITTMSHYVNAGLSVTGLTATTVNNYRTTKKYNKVSLKTKDTWFLTCGCKGNIYSLLSSLLKWKRKFKPSGLIITAAPWAHAALERLKKYFYQFAIHG